MTQLKAMERRLVMRYVDGELDGAERAAFERRMLAEPALREEVEEQREQRGWFDEDGDEQPARAPADLARRVLHEIERPAALAAGAVAEESAELVRFGMRLQIAAAVLFGVSMLLWSGVLKPADSPYLHAADQQRINEMDRQIELMESKKKQAREWRNR